MKVNFSKTKFIYLSCYLFIMLFHKEHDSAKDVPEFLIRDSIIERVTKFKYLGVWLDVSLNFNEHYNCITNKLPQRIKMLHGIKRYIDIQALRTLVNAHLHSVLDYCIEIWSVVCMSKLLSLQNIVSNFFMCYFYPKLARNKSNKHSSYVKLLKSIDSNQLLVKCNFLTVQDLTLYETSI